MLPLPPDTPTVIGLPRNRSGPQSPIKPKRTDPQMNPDDLIPTDVRIRPATMGDVDTITQYNAALASETENIALDPEILRQGVRTALADPTICHYFIAERGGQTVGQCMVSFEWSDWRNGWLWWFQSVYVHRDHRRCGVFRALYKHVHAAALAADNVTGLRLYVERENHSAMNTYAQLGMKPSGHIVYEHDWSPKTNSGHAGAP
jgi:GNAT superfamily N-acetyltransferase